MTREEREAAAAAAALGVGATLSTGLPRAAQTAAKVPSPAAATARTAASSAANAAFYSTQAKATLSVTNLENAYRGASAIKQRGLMGAIVGAGRNLRGLTALALKVVAGAGAILAVSEGLFTRGTLDGTDEAIALSRARSKQLGLAYPSEAKEIQPGIYPFQGGQSPVLYNITGSYRILYNSGNHSPWRNAGGQVMGPISSIGLKFTPSSTTPGNVRVRNHATNSTGEVGIGTSVEYTVANSYGIEQTGWTLARADNLPDTGGNPPATTEPIYSVASGIQIGDYTPTVGEVESPPPALISQPGDFLYDGARAPLQRVMDGTPPPWARAENPVARLPGARTVPSVPAAPADIPQPDVAPSPNQDDKPANPYPFFDPVTFPDTTTPNIFDIPPAFTPRPLTVKPITVEPLRPTTDDSPRPEPIKIPGLVPSTGTPFAPNPTTRSPEPATKTPEPVKTEPPPEKTPTEKILEQLPEIATGVALLTPFMRGIQDNTSPEKLIPIVKEGACQSLNGGCTNGVNIPSQLAQNGTKLDALQVGLQGLDLSLLGTIDQKLGAQVPGGISNLLTKTKDRINKVGEFLQIDRLLNILIWWQTLHNAFMLSNNIATTLTSALSQALAALPGNSLLGIPTEEEGGSPLDIGTQINGMFENAVKGAIGADNYTSIKASWAKANRIYQAAANVVFSVQGLIQGLQSIAEATGENVGKVGNALKSFGVVGEKAYNWMAEKMSVKTAWMQKLENNLNSASEMASNLESVTSNVASTGQTIVELQTQKTEFDNALKDITKSDRPDNTVVKAKSDADKTASESPDIAPKDLDKADTDSD